MIEIKARPGFDVHEVGDVDLEPPRDAEQHVERRVPLPALNLGEIPEGETDPVRRVGLRPTEPPPSPLNPSCNATTKCLGAHPQDETRSRFYNVTHCRSLRLRARFP